MTSTGVNTINVFLNGVLEISWVNVAMSGTGTAFLQFMTSTAMLSATFSWFADIYVDDGNTATDPGNIIVTAKRPFANGTLNEWTTQVGAGSSGYGSGHALQVNERPLSLTNAWSITNAALKTEEYTIEGAAVGDLDLTNPNYRIVDYMGWANLKCASAQTGNIIVNGVASNVSLTTTATVFLKAAGSTIYPSGATAIGADTNTVNALFTLAECGILVAAVWNVATAIESLKADAEFTPDLLGPRVWLDAGSFVANDGDLLTVWTDSSGNGFDATNTGGIQRPTYKTNIINGLPVVRFGSGAANRFVIPPIAVQPFTIIFVAKINSTASAIWYLVDTQTGGSGRVTLSTSSGTGFLRMQAVGSLAATTGNQTNAWHIFSTIWNGASSAAFVDGVQNVATGSAGAEWTVLNNFIFLGIDQSGTVLTPIDYAEFVLCNRALSTTERRQIEGYFSAKYALPASGSLTPLPIRTIACAPRLITDAVSTAESVDHYALEPHSALDTPAIAESTDWIGVLSRTTTD